MNERLFTFLVYLWSIVFALLVLFGAGFYAFLFYEGRVEVSPALTSAIVNFLVLVLTSLGGYIAYRLQVRKLDKQTDEIVNKVQNGASDVIARKVVENAKETLAWVPTEEQKSARDIRGSQG